MEIKLQIKNTVTRIICPEILRKEVSHLLSYEVPGAQFAMRKLPPGAWDGRKRLMKRDGSFPAGLTVLVMKFLYKKGYNIDIVEDLRTKPERRHDFKFNDNGVELRPYQIEVNNITDKRPRGIFVLGTGAGKGLNSVFIVKRRGLDTLFVTPDTGLREQTFKVFSRFFDKRDLSKDANSHAPIVISNIQALIRKDPRIFQRFKMLMIDEFHHAACESYLKLNLMLTEAYWRYGLTGTHLRTDSRDMIMNGVLSNVLLEKSASDLIKEGWLVPPEVTFYKYRVRKFSRYNYKEAYRQAVLEPGFNRIVTEIAFKKISEGKQILILVRQLEHGNLLSEMLRGKAIFLSGEDKVEYREKIKKAFAERSVKCLIASSIFGEGQDVPSIDVLINARLQESEIQTKQGVGRALRLAEGAKNYEQSVLKGKSKAEIYDFFIEGNRYLKDHSESRLSQYQSEPAFKVEVKEDFLEETPTILRRKKSL